MNLSFPKKEHLCFKRRIDALLAQGKSFFIYPYRVIYLLNDPPDDSIPVQVAISVRKKQFKRAVTRNLLKRRFRESWRHRKAELNELLAQEGKSMYILMVYGANEVLPYAQIDSGIELIIRKLKKIALVDNTQ